MNNKVLLSPNDVVSFLEKSPENFTREDMLRFICENGIEMINFMYPAEDGRVKTLNFVTNKLQNYDRKKPHRGEKTRKENSP